MRRIIRTTAVSSLAVAVALLPQLAHATHGTNDWMVPTANLDITCVSTLIGSPTAVPCQTDNDILYWYADSNDPGELEENDFISIQSVLANEYVPTDLAVSYDPTPTLSGSGQTDIVYQEAEAGMTIPFDALGIMWCAHAASAKYECDRANVRIYSPDGYRVHGGSIGCHETGHAVGLVHGVDAAPALDDGDSRLGCMVNEDLFPSDLGPGSSHLIDLTYP